LQAYPHATFPYESGFSRCHENPELQLALFSVFGYISTRKQQQQKHHATEKVKNFSFFCFSLLHPHCSIYILRHHHVSASAHLATFEQTDNFHETQ
jgi:hypothetical protein